MKIDLNIEEIVVCGTLPKSLNRNELLQSLHTEICNRMSRMKNPETHQFQHRIDLQVSLRDSGALGQQIASCLFGDPAGEQTARQTSRDAASMPEGSAHHAVQQS